MASRARRISLCMVVRDEEAMLEGCLAAARGVWDELVVVDTGSTDATRAIAQRFGAKVVDFPWCDDFAAARNAGLHVASGAWVLVVDADERLSEELKGQLRRVAKDRRAGAATLVMKNVSASGQARRARLLRFFRAGPEIRFSHRIHEDVTGPVAAALAASGQKLVALSGECEHLGYSPGQMKSRGKRERDQKLLQRCLTENPDDLYSAHKLLESAAYWRDDALGAEVAQQALAALGRAEPATLARLHFGGNLLAGIGHALGKGNPQRALEAIDGFFGTVRPSAALHLRRAELRERLGDSSGARASFRACLAFPDELGDLQHGTVRPLMGLARLAIAESNLSEAAQRADQALRYDPRDSEALTVAALLTCRVGLEGSEANLLQRYGDTAEVRAALGEVALFKGHTSVAVEHLQCAARGSGDARVSLRLAQAYLADGRLAPTRALVDQLRGDLPEAALGVLVCDLIDGVDSNLEVDLSQGAADACLREWIAALTAPPAKALFGRFRAAAPAAAGAFPWLPSAVGAPAAEVNS